MKEGDINKLIAKHIAEASDTGHKSRYYIVLLKELLAFSMFLTAMIMVSLLLFI